MALGISESWAYILWMRKLWQGEIHTCVPAAFTCLAPIISVNTNPTVFALPFNSHGRGRHTVLHGLLGIPLSNSPIPLPWNFSPVELCSWREVGMLLAPHRRCWHPRWDTLSTGRNSDAEKVPLACSEISPGASCVGRVWAWQRSVHQGKNQIVTERKSFSRLPLSTWTISNNKAKTSLWSITKCFWVFSTAFGLRSESPWVVLSQSVIWMMWWTAHQHGRPEWDLCTLPWCEGLWSLHPNAIDVGVWRATARDTSQDTALHGLQGSGSSESRSTCGICGGIQPSGEVLSESLRACCWWAADRRGGNKSILFWTIGYALSLRQT